MIWSREGRALATASHRNQEPDEPARLNDAVWAPDQPRLATAGADGRAFLWSYEAARPERERLQAVELKAPGKCLAHAGPVTSVSWSPGGRVLTTGDDSIARLWDARSGQLAATLGGHAGPVLRGSFSPDGALAITASSDRTARIWDVASGAQVQVLGDHTGAVRDARLWLGPRHRLAVTGDDDGTVRLWDASTGALAASFRAHGKPVERVAFIRSGDAVVSTGADGYARILPTSRPDVLAVLCAAWSAVNPDEHPRPSACLSLLPSPPGER